LQSSRVLQRAETGVQRQLRWRKMAEEVRGGGEPSLWKVEGCEESTMMRSWTLVTAKPWGQRILIPSFWLCFHKVLKHQMGKESKTFPIWSQSRWSRR
jgi:hypothetical protein